MAGSVVMPPVPSARSVMVDAPAESGMPETTRPTADSSREAQLGRPVAETLETGRSELLGISKVSKKGNPTLPFLAWLGGIAGAPSAIVKAILVAVPVPPMPVAVKEAVNEPLVVGVPVMLPVLTSRERPSGSPVALHEVAGRSKASSSAGVPENATPTFAEKLCPLVIIGVPTAIEIVAVSVSVPPGPVAVSVIVALPLSCGVPVIWPVVELMVAQLGRPVALHEVTGRLVESVRLKVLLKAVPTLPEAVWPAVMIGAPSAMVNPTLVTLVPPDPVAVTLALNKPATDGVPNISPELLIDSPAGKLVALHEVAGRSEASCKDRAWENISPTLPVKVCPEVMRGAPMAIEIVAVSVSVPPGPVAVSVIVALPLSCGVPVIAPVAVFSVAQLGNPVALQLVTGRFVESVSENVLENASPTLPAPVWFGGMIGAPSEIEKLTLVAGLVPPLPVAVKEAVKLPFVVGVPVIAPVLVFSERPVGMPMALHEVAGRSTASVSEIVPENAFPTLPLKLCPATIMGDPIAMEIVAVSVSDPPGPVAVSVIVALPLSCGVPVIVPVLVLIAIPAGNSVALHEVTDLFVLSVSENVLLNADPTLPEAVWPGVMIGAPSAIVKLTLVALLVPPPPVAVKEAVNEPLAVGVPVISPVVVLIDSPAGSPVALQEVAGRSSASSSAGVSLNATPTLPVKLWPDTIIGGPTKMSMVIVSVFAPPDPVAVSVMVEVPLSCGVPVIAPVGAFSVAQLGRPVADQLEAWRFAASVKAGMALNAVPTLPVKN